LRHEREGEGAAAPDRALNGDVAAVQLRQAAGDGETQPRAAALLQRACPHLHEGLEQLRYVVCGDADPSVAHLNAYAEARAVHANGPCGALAVRARSCWRGGEHSGGWQGRPCFRARLRFPG
jgi:hypothetical protein